jgi:hypothetical protein
MKDRNRGPVLVAAIGGAAVLALVVGGRTLWEPRPSHAPKATLPAPSASADDASASLAVPVTSLAKPRFAWPVPGAVDVIEHVSKGEGDATTTYTIEVCRRGSDQLSVIHRDFAFQRVEGRSPDDPAVAAAVAQIAPISAAIPAFIINASGTLLEVEGIDGMLQRMEKAMPGNISRVRDALKTPAARSALSAAIGERWQAWVGVWTRFEPAKGAQQVISDTFPGPPPTTVNSELSVDRVWAKNHVKLAWRTTLTGTQAAGLAKLLVKSFGARDMPLDGYELSGNTLIEADMDWPSLRPKWVHTLKSITVTGAGSVSKVEDHEYTFGPWSASTRCDTK